MSLRFNERHLVVFIVTSILSCATTQAEILSILGIIIMLHRHYKETNLAQ